MNAFNVFLTGHSTKCRCSVHCWAICYLSLFHYLFHVCNCVTVPLPVLARTVLDFNLNQTSSLVKQKLNKHILIWNDIMHSLYAVSILTLILFLLLSSSLIPFYSYHGPFFCSLHAPVLVLKIVHWTGNLNQSEIAALTLNFWSNLRTYATVQPENKAKINRE